VRRAHWRWLQRSVPPYELAERHLAGLTGVEIGASATNPFPNVVANVDRYASMDTVYKQEEKRVTGFAVPVDVVAEAHDLPFADDAYDFVLASHVLEHVPDPIAALKEWVRVARVLVFVIVPHRDRTFDRDRPVTSVAELLERHRTRFRSDRDDHWTVWTCESFLELCDAIGLEVIETEDPDRKVGNGFAVVIRAGQAAGANEVNT
jgi:SAM-dependent methyltransferase